MSQRRARSVETSILLAGVFHATVVAAPYAIFIRDETAYSVGPDVPVVLLAVAFFGCEFFALRVERIHGESYGFTLALVPLAVGLAYVAPGALVAARLAGVAVALVPAVVLSHQRKVQEALYELAVHAL